MKMPSHRRSPLPFLLPVLREPTVHFLLIGAALFALDALIAPASVPEPDDRFRVVVTEGRVRQLAQGFARTWQRPPTAGELRGLIDAFVKEEIYYREALRMGLDRGDTLVRRRMQQKMEFLIEPDQNALRADDADLRTHLDANREFFRRPAQAAFRQVLIGSITESNPEDRAKRLLVRLRAGPQDIELSALGDQTLLPRAMTLTPADQIARIFGPEFAETLSALPRDQWSGPVRSAYGLHLVWITGWEDAIDPSLENIRAEVERHWRQARRTEHMQAEYEKLRGRYEVILPAALEERPP